MEDAKGVGSEGWRRGRFVMVVSEIGRVSFCTRGESRERREVRSTYLVEVLGVSGALGHAYGRVVWVSKGLFEWDLRFLWVDRLLAKALPSLARLFGSRWICCMVVVVARMVVLGR